MTTLKIKRYFLIPAILILSLFFVSFSKFEINAQFPSFEIYNSGCGLGLNCTSYPTVINVNVSGPDDNIVTITADAHDVSGVLAVVAIIKKPSGNVLQTMQKITDLSYGASVNVSTYPEGIYYVDIFATDIFLNNSMNEGNEYTNVGSFKIGSSADWLEGWSYRKKITIDHTNIDSDLNDFPLYVKISSDSDLSKAQDDGDDIRFTLSDGTTLLSYEEESWSGGDGSPATADYWVKVPIISNSSNTYIYIYYGKSGGSGEDAENVWDANYKAVYHLKEVVGNKWADSTSNKNDGNNSGVTPTAGKIAGAGSFNYSYIESKKQLGISGYNPFTVETWMFPGSNPRSSYYYSDVYGRCVVSWGSASCNSAYFLYYDTEDYDTSGGRNRFEVGFYCNDKIDTPQAYPKNNWYYAVNTYDGSNNTMFVNGAQSFSWTPGMVYVSDTKFRVGLDNFPDRSHGTDHQGRYFNGVIDEVRISNVVRSDDWLKFEYHNINEPDNEIYFYPEETQ